MIHGDGEDDTSADNFEGTLELLARGTDDLQVGSPPIEAAMAAGRQSVRLRRRALSVGCVAAAVAAVTIVAAGTLGAGHGEAHDRGVDPAVTPSSTVLEPSPSWPADGWDGEAAPAGMVAGRTDDGEKGYIYRRDLVTPECKTPTDCVEMMNNLHKSGRVLDNGDIVVKVYAKDGTTEIGTFTSGHVG